MAEDGLPSQSLGRWLSQVSKALPQSLLPSCTPSWATRQVLHAQVRTDLEDTPHHLSFGLYNCNECFLLCPQAGPQKKPREKSQFFLKASLGEGI